MRDKSEKERERTNRDKKSRIEENKDKEDRKILKKQKHS